VSGGLCQTAPLAGFTVVELSAGATRGVPIAGRILADLGAEVIAVSRPGHEHAPIARGKTVLAEDGAPRPAELFAQADVVLVDRETYLKLSGEGGAPDVIAVRHPRLVYACLSPFGLTGPWRDRPGGEIAVQAAGSVLLSNGTEDDPPLPAGIPIAAYGGAILAVIGILGALYEREVSGLGQFLDQAEFDALVAFSGTLLPTYFLSRGPLRRLGNRHAMAAPWNTYRTADSWVVVCTMNDTQFRALCAAIGRDDLAGHPDYATATRRVANAARLDAEIGEWARARTTAEALSALEPGGVICGPIRTMPEVVRDPHARWRKVILPVDGGGVASGSFLKFDLVPGPPALPSDASRDLAGQPLSGTATGLEDRGPLHGTRVVEVAAHTAGPLAGRLLALLGAEVVKVEPPGGEPARHLAQQVAGQGYLFQVNNTDKLGVTLDIGQPGDRERLLELLAGSDALVTNMAAATLAAHDLGADRVTAMLPHLVYCGLSGFGPDGPYGGRKAFDMVVQARSGIMSLTSNEHGEPRKVGMSVADLLGACSAALGTVAALLARRRDGRGRIVDATLFDVAVWVTQDSWASPSSPAVTGRCVRAGNGYLAIEDWPRAAGRLGAALNLTRADRLDRTLAELDVDELRELCGRLGIAAAVPLGVHEVAEAAHTWARGLVSDVIYDGEPVRVIGSPFHYSRTRSRVRRAAPTLGRDTAAVLARRDAGTAGPVPGTGQPRPRSTADSRPIP
jgi:crotonobetainyl-CoA:carnitine CoA-transferase CaiB-like acyl-CoA transferase